ncbi:hypothetical protein ZWY2020_059556 [Hordeum vulgare]|nr:hypothetical protein ZWY2020_059556 [Hordeum vulgare]
MARRASPFRWRDGALCSRLIESVRSTPPDPCAAMPPQLRLSAASLPPLASPRRGPRWPPPREQRRGGRGSPSARRLGLAECDWKFLGGGDGADALEEAEKVRVAKIMVLFLKIHEKEERPLKGTEMAVSLLMDAVGSKQAIQERSLQEVYQRALKPSAASPPPALRFDVGCHCGAGAHLTSQRIAAARSGNGRGTVLAAGTGARELTHRRCSPGPPPDMEDQPVIKNKGDDAWEALKAEMVDMFRPLLRNIAEFCSLRRPYDHEDYQIGMTVPSIFVDVMLAYLFYKLSVVSSDLHKRHKSNSLITRLKFGISLFLKLLFSKDIKKNYVLLYAIRMPVFLLYICAFLFDVAGVKKYGRRGLIYFVNLLKTRGGIQEMYRIMWYPGYISPYDDSIDWLRDS